MMNQVIEIITLLLLLLTINLDMPKLQLAAADGSIVAKIDKARNTATFSKLAITNMNLDEGNFNLEFIAVDEESSTSPLTALTFPFKIFSDAHKEAEVARLVYYQH